MYGLISGDGGGASDESDGKGEWGGNVASGTFRIRFNTGSIEKKNRFEVTYSVNGGQPQIVKVSRDDIRRQIALDGTDGQYQFMMEFIYSAITVPDFVTIRVSGVPVKAAEGQSSVLVQR